METYTIKEDLRTFRQDITEKWDPWWVLLEYMISASKYTGFGAVVSYDLSIPTKILSGAGASEPPCGSSQQNHMPFGIRGVSAKLNTFFKLEINILRCIFCQMVLPSPPRTLTYQTSAWGYHIQENVLTSYKGNDYLLSLILHSFQCSPFWIKILLDESFIVVKFSENKYARVICLLSLSTKMWCNVIYKLGWWG